MLIHNVKFYTNDDPILQNPSQESLMPSKYDFVLCRLIFMKRAENEHTTQEWHTMLISDKR